MMVETSSSFRSFRDTNEGEQKQHWRANDRFNSKVVLEDNIAIDSNLFCKESLSYPFLPTTCGHQHKPLVATVGKKNKIRLVVNLRRRFIRLSIKWTHFSGCEPRLRERETVVCAANLFMVSKSATARGHALLLSLCPATVFTHL